MNAQRRGAIARASYIALAVAAGWSASAASAQTADSPAAAQTANSPAAAATTNPGSNNGDIIVTAQFRSQKLQDTPLAITALDAKLLQARSITNFSDLGAQVPNVVIKPAGSVFGPASQVFIRGIGQGDTSFALEPGVGVYIDDVYYSTVFGSIFDLVDLDRVEILRGPQGTLAGKNSIGGAVKLFSAKPSDDFGGYLEASGGSFNELGLRGSVNIPIVADKLALRIAGVAQYSDGYVKSYDYGCLHPSSGVPSVRTSSSSCQIGSEGGQNYYGLRATLRWQVSSDVDVTVIGDRSIDRSEPAATVLTAVNPLGRSFLNGVRFDSKFVTGGSYINYATYTDSGGIYSPTYTAQPSGYALPRDNNLKDGGVSATISARLADNLHLTSISAFRQYHGTFSSDADESPFTFQLVSNDFRHRQISQEVRLTGNSFDRMLDWTVGGFYFDSHDRVGGRVFYPTVFDTLIDDPVISHSLSGFAHATFHVTRQFNITGGIRYSNESKSYTYNRMDPNTGLPPPSLAAINGVSAESKAHRFDYKINADYHVLPDVMVYGQVATGYRSGGINPRPFYSNQVVPFDPETLTAFEAGFKSQFADRKATLNGAVFLSRYSNILVQTDNPYVNANEPINNDPTSPTYNPAAGTFPSTVVINGGKADLKGFELEGKFRPIEHFDIDASVGYLTFKYTSLAASAIASGITLDTKRPYTPKWKWNVGAQYEIPLGAIGSLTPRIDMSFQGSMFTGDTQNFYNTIDSYTVANAHLSWNSSDRKTQASLAVTNLFDKYYYLNKFETYSLSGIALGQPGRPREWRLTVRRSF